MSISKEDFIKAMYMTTEERGMSCTTSQLSKILNISNPAVTDMARKLDKEGLIHYKKYKESELTKTGKLKALNLIRKHRLWETFLHTILEIPMDRIHEEAENLEHLTSDYLAERIEVFMNNPEFDPHGEPIPNKNGLIKERSGVKLELAEEGKNYQIIRVSIQDESLASFLRESGIKTGMKIKVVKKLNHGNGIYVQSKSGKIMIQQPVSSDILLKEIN